ncbi:reverse transcriptase domain-containing protein [Tanacetum coccineum]
MVAVNTRVTGNDGSLNTTMKFMDVNAGQTPTSPIVKSKPCNYYANLFTAGPTISARFANTVYGFFLGKRVAYPVVANYVRNTWSLDAILENGPWFICNNPLILKKWNPDVNLLKEDMGNVPVWVKLHGVPMTAFSEDGLSVITTKLGTPLMLDSYTSDMCIQSYGRSSYARAMIEVRADVELKDTIVVAMPKLTGESNFKGVPVGLKVGFKPVKQVYNRKKDAEPIIEVSNSNPFNALNSVENDVDLGTNVGTSNLASKETNSSGSSFWNVGSSSTSTTPIVDKIDKLEKLIIDGKVSLVDDEGKPLKKVDYPGNHDSEDEVELVDNEMTSFLASERVGFGTNSLLE